MAYLKIYECVALAIDGRFKEEEMKAKAKKVLN